MVAENVRALLQLLCFDAEPMVDWGRVIFHKDDDEPDSDAHAHAHEDYVEWLKSEFDLDGADPKQVTAQAEAKHKAAFTARFARFCPD